MAAATTSTFEQFVREHAGFEDVPELWMRYAGPAPIPFAYRRGVFSPASSKTLHESFVRIRTLRSNGGAQPLVKEERAAMRTEWRRMPNVQKEAFNPCYRRWASLEQAAGRDVSLLRWKTERAAFLAAHEADPLCVDLRVAAAPRVERRPAAIKGRSDFLRAAAKPISRLVIMKKDSRGRSRFALQNAVWRRAVELMNAAEPPSDEVGEDASEERASFRSDLDGTPSLEPCHKQALMEAFDDHDVRFLDGVTVPTANAVRRTLVSRLPTPAIASVAVHSFDCCQHEEFVVHRLAMLPVVDELCRSEAPPGDPVTMTLDVSCDSQTEFRVVTDRDLVAHTPSVRVWACEAPVEIARLRSGQRVHLTATVGWGTARQHAKFQQVVTAFHRVVPRITVPAGVAPADLRRACPRGVFDIEDVPDVTKCVDCGGCAGLGVEVFAGAKHQAGDASRQLRFEIEPLTSHRPAQFHVDRAVKVLLGDLDGLEADLGNLMRSF